MIQKTYQGKEMNQKQLIEDSITGELFNPDNLPLQVCRSNAGYYIGKTEPGGCPYSRESGSWKTYEEADQALVRYLNGSD